MQQYWIGVVSREHVKRGEAGSFCQLCHGKAWPMRKMKPDDWLIYYSPREKMRGGDPVQAFTAIGKINNREPYEFDMGGFIPTRRDVTYYPAKNAPIRPMLEALSFIPDLRSWGMVFRRGMIEISRADFILIATAMGVMVDKKIMPQNNPIEQ